MVARSKEIWLVAFYLSNFGDNSKKKSTQPPVELNVNNWNAAYRLFYDTLSQGRSILSFEHSLKNARDSYDSVLGNSTRTGWRDSNKSPKKLEKIALEIFEKYRNVEKTLIWEEIKIYANYNFSISEIVVNDLISIQESETDEPIMSKSEGKKKIITSYKYERNLKLRTSAIDIHGENCMICGFNFEKFYGEWGRGFIEVHHSISLSTYEQEKMTNPKEDLIVLCANCHRMVHRKKGITLTLEELKQKIKPACLHEQ